MRRLLLLLWTVFAPLVATTQVESSKKADQETFYRTRSIESLAPEQAEAAMNVAAEPSPSPAYLLDRYRLERRSRYTGSGRTLSGRDQSALDAQLAAMELSCGNTPAYAFACWEHNGFLKEDFQVLEQISATNADASLSALDRTVADAVNAAIYNQSDALEHALLTLATLHNIDSSVQSLHQNALHSAQRNAVLITHGFEDTFALLQHQREGMREDVKIVHLDWLRNPDYAAAIYQLVGITHASTASPEDHLRNLVNAAASSTRPIYLSTTLPTQALLRLGQDLYPEGVLLRCHKPLSFDNILATVTWWEQRADRSQLTSGAAINRNYLIALSILNNFYTQSGESVNAAEIQELLHTLTPHTKQQSRVKQVTDY